MGHFAKVEDGIVTDVIVADQEFIDSMPIDGNYQWIQTSYNTRGNVHYGQDGFPDGEVALRKNYASIGYTYDAVLDAFIPPKSFQGWLLNQETGLWYPPTPAPQVAEGEYTYWDNASMSWQISPLPEN